MRGVARIAPPQLRIVTIRHGLNVFVIILPCFGHFGWPFLSQDGPPEKKSHLESGLNQRDRATAGFGRDRSHGKPSKIFYCRGFDGGAGATKNGVKNATTEKDKANAKPNARRAGNGLKGASKTMRTLARDGSNYAWRALKPEWFCGSNTPHGASGMRPRKVFERARVTAQ